MPLSLLAAFGAGTATLATPCVLPLVPVYLTMLLGGALPAAATGRARGQLVVRTLAFSLGFTLVFTIFGLGASSLGQVLGQHRDLLMLVGATLIALFGLKFLGVLPLPWLDRDLRLDGPRRIQGPLGGFGFGVVFAFGWTPCAGPVLASVLSVAALQSSALQGAGLLAAYSAGLAAPLIVVAVFADRAVPLLRKAMRRLETLQRVTGVAMLALALFLGVGPVRALLAAPAATQLATTEDGLRIAPLPGAPLSQPRLLELVEEGCPVCQRMQKAVDTLQADCTAHHVEVHRIDVSRDDNRWLKAALGVRAVPTVLLIDDLGQERARLVGERGLDELRGLAASLQAATCAGVDPVDVEGVDQRDGCGDTAAGSAETCS
ncbi:MAG: cytochrome c biogenesis protein CcdA [Pseudomonadota bacterium]